MRRLFPILLACALAGCSSTNPDAARVKRVVHGFAEASGPRACDYLTDHALQQLYAGGGHPPRIDHAREIAECRRQAGRFSGRPVKITRVWFPAADEARAFAHLPGASNSYTVYLRRGGGSWLVNKITH